MLSTAVGFDRGLIEFPLSTVGERDIAFNDSPKQKGGRQVTMTSLQVVGIPDTGLEHVIAEINDGQVRSSHNFQSP